MTVAIALVSGLLVLGLTLADGSRRSQRRDQLLRSDPLEWGDEAAHLSSGIALGSLLSMLVAGILGYHLAAAAGIPALQNRWNALGLAAAAVSCAVQLLTRFQIASSMEDARGPAAQDPAATRDGPSKLLPLLAFLLITEAVVLLATLGVRRDPYTFVRNAGIASTVALVVMVGFWVWLARVWHQQLDGGRAWTTAGRLIPVARLMAFVAAALALAAGLRATLQG